MSADQCQHEWLVGRSSHVCWKCCATRSFQFEMPKSLAVSHTTGPWKVRFPDPEMSPHYWVVESVTGRAIADFPRLDRDARSQQKGDAYLIAAAPEMYDELVSLELFLQAVEATDYPVGDQLDSVRAVIAKAKKP